MSMHSLTHLLRCFPVFCDDYKVLALPVPNTFSISALLAPVNIIIYSGHPSNPRKDSPSTYSYTEPA